MAEDDEAHVKCEVESDSEAESSDDDELPENERVAKKRKARMDSRLMEEIGKGQGVLHFVKNMVNGPPEEQLPSMSGSAMEVLRPTLAEDLTQRAQTTIAHISLLALSTLPVTLLYMFYHNGIEQFGYGGMDAGIIPKGHIYHVIRFMFILSFYLFNFLLCGLILHYFFSEFNGDRFPCLRPITRSVFAQWLLVQWKGFQYLQATCMMMSLLVLASFAINAACGLLLHFFTNMFAVTAIIGTWAAVFTNLRIVNELLDTVMAEVNPCLNIMDNLKEGLTKRIIELAVGEQKVKQQKLKLHKLLVSRSLISPRSVKRTMPTTAWYQLSQPAPCLPSPPPALIVPRDGQVSAARRARSHERRGARTPPTDHRECRGDGRRVRCS